MPFWLKLVHLQKAVVFSLHCHDSLWFMSLLLFSFLSHYHYHYPSCHSASQITDHSHHCWRHYSRHSCYHQIVFVCVFIFCCISHFPMVFPSIHSIFRALFDTATCFNKPQRWCQWVDFTLLCPAKKWYTHTIAWDKKVYSPIHG